jgi:5-methylcytosine-specific restriction endonuclease McrA
VSRRVPLARAEERYPAAVAAMVRRVDRVVRTDPLPRLQSVKGLPQEPFLYEIEAGGQVIRFKPGAADALVRLAPLVRPLVELHWVREVAKRNNLAREERLLYRHLFGALRAGFPGKLRDLLREFQCHECFYCGDPLSAIPPIDHFIPWSRYPNDAIENLVVSHTSCNGLKSDRIAASDHLKKWCHRFTVEKADLEGIALAAKWDRDPERSSGLVRSVYRHLPPGAPLWSATGHGERADQAVIGPMLDSCA